MSNFARFLGTGASLGVPLIGCSCAVCSSQDPKNNRLRSSLFLSISDKKILIDAGPDLRLQALRYGLTHLDGVIFTHAHHDHTAGIDDLRIYHFKHQAPLPCLVSQQTAEDLHRRYYFMFTPSLHGERLRLQILEKRVGEVDFLGIPIHYFSYDQLGMQVLGIRIGSFAYVTDIKEYTEEIIQHLKGVETLVVSALRFAPSQMHLTVDEAVEFINKIHPQNAYLTHVSHELDHEKTNVYLPATIQLAYDGLQIPI
jgi:phosphoribosyl 1,2-cyclic phosphate phosphodiesterase